jgi:hypothetical protein
VYRENSTLTRPSHSLQPLWRYLKVERLTDLISTESLYFRRLSLMGDKWEGLLTAKTSAVLLRHFYGIYHDASIANAQIEDYEKHREEFYVNCWHMNNAESYLMWKVYADRGCAIETTFERIRIAFDGFMGEIEGSVIDYIDYKREKMPVGNIYQSVVRKDLPYKDEREFRLLFWQHSLANQKIEVGLEGIKIGVNLNKLIARIWLNPQYEESTREIVRLVEAKGLDCEICNSAINEVSRKSAANPR